MEGFFKLSSMISPPKNPLRASIPQGRVLGTLLWNAYHRDILQLTPQAQAYTDDCALTFTCDRNHQAAAVK